MDYDQTENQFKKAGGLRMVRSTAQAKAEILSPKIPLRILNFLSNGKSRLPATAVSNIGPRGKLGLEYQVLDDESHRDNKIPSHRAGSLYDLIAAPDDKAIRPVGEWNKGKIIAQGNQIEHWMNGTKIIEIIWGSPEWEKCFGKSKYRQNKGFGSWQGPILLQDHNDPAWFKGFKIKKL